MKVALSTAQLPDDALLVVCSNHEHRSGALVSKMGRWRPASAVILRYADSISQGQQCGDAMISSLRECCNATVVPFQEDHLTANFNSHTSGLMTVFDRQLGGPIVVDVSVLTKRHLLLLLQWLDDCGWWDRLWIVYSEPDEYEIEGHLPLSFGVSCVLQLPGFSSSPNPSRPLHAVMFLGYEGDRAFATYELLQPQTTTVVIPDPPFRQCWKGRTEAQNKNLLAAIGQYALEGADSLDPDSSEKLLHKVFGRPEVRGENSRAICPLGTKPQTIGAYRYVRACSDPPAMIYSRALRHNHSFYSRGVGPTWVIHQPC